MKVFSLLVLTVFYESYSYPDLTPQAITVYRNPEFFKNLYHVTKFNHNEKTTKTPERSEKYKYPGETKRPSPPVSSTGFEVNYDNSPEFHHEPRDIFIGSTHKPTRKKGPYSPSTHGEENSSIENQANKSEEKSVIEDYATNDDHEPVLLARPNVDPYEKSAVTGKGSSKGYGKTGPVLYDDWKYQNYPKIYFNEHLQSDSSRLYSEEPPSNSFEDEFSSYAKYDDDEDGADDLFRGEGLKNLGADTKHIYKKLLKPKKSVTLKFHSKPMLKKLKFKLKKKHNKDWFDEYPFDF